MEKHLQIAENETLTTVYNSTVVDDVDFCLQNDFSTEEIAQKFVQKLEERKLEEIIRAQSLVGPHRDDVSFFINGIEAKKFASQGQTKNGCPKFKACRA